MVETPTGETPLLAAFANGLCMITSNFVFTTRFTRRKSSVTTARLPIMVLAETISVFVGLPATFLVNSKLVVGLYESWTIHLILWLKGPKKATKIVCFFDCKWWATRGCQSRVRREGIKSWINIVPATRLLQTAEPRKELIRYVDSRLPRLRLIRSKSSNERYEIFLQGTSLYHPRRLQGGLSRTPKRVLWSNPPREVLYLFSQFGMY